MSSRRRRPSASRTSRPSCTAPCSTTFGPSDIDTDPHRRRGHVRCVRRARHRPGGPRGRGHARVGHHDAMQAMDETDLPGSAAASRSSATAQAVPTCRRCAPRRACHDARRRGPAHRLSRSPAAVGDEAVDAPLSLVQRLRQLADEQPDAVLLHPRRASTGRAGRSPCAELDRRSSQVAGALAAKGVGLGDRVALGLRNSPEFVRQRLRRLEGGRHAGPGPVGPARTGSSSALREVDRRPGPPRRRRPALDPEHRRRRGARPARRAVAARCTGICSSGSTGHAEDHRQRRCPAVLQPGLQHADDGAVAAGGPPADVLVLAPMYHVNAFATLHNLLAGDRLVVLEKFDAARAVDAIERHRVTTLHGDADDAAAHRRPARRRRPRPVEHRVDPPGRGADAAVARAPLGRPHRPRADPHGLRHDRGHRHHRPRRATSGWRTRAASGEAMRDTEVRILDDDGDEVPTGEIGEIYLRSPCLRRLRLPRRGAAAAAPPTTASRPSATWATSTRTATSTWSTAAST